MSWDDEVPPYSRRCAATGAVITPGQRYFTALVLEDGKTERRDYACEAWQGPPTGTLGWWQSEAPAFKEAPRLAPQDVLLNFFAELADVPSQVELRYVLALLLLRKRLLRLVETRSDPQAGEIWVLEYVGDSQQVELPAAAPGPAAAAAIEQQLHSLLYGDAAADSRATSPGPPTEEAA